MIKIYTDGAASPNPGYGGWACTIQCKGPTGKVIRKECQLPRAEARGLQGGNSVLSP